MSESNLEPDLIRKAAGGDAVAYQQFLLKNRHTLLRYIDRHLPQELRRRLDPQDVYQDVCFDAFRDMQRFKAEDPGAALRWLLRIARNRLVDTVRANRAAKRAIGAQTDLEGDPISGEDDLIEALQELAIYRHTPSQSAVRRELHALLEQCLTQLSADHGSVIRLRYIEQLSVDETAQRMNRSTGAVHMLSTRALKQLRVELRSMSRYL